MATHNDPHKNPDQNKDQGQKKAAADEKQKMAGQKPGDMHSQKPAQKK